MGKYILDLRLLPISHGYQLKNSKKNFVRMIPSTTFTNISGGLQEEGHGVVQHVLGHFKGALQYNECHWLVHIDCNSSFTLYLATSTTWMIQTGQLEFHWDEYLLALSSHHGPGERTFCLVLEN